MIQELKKLTSIDFPFKNDNEFKIYLEEINTIGYNNKVLEKDFYLTALLWIIGIQIPEIVFKWWTCLNKIHFPYFRLSEDLDFSLPIENHWESKRKQIAHYIDEKINTISKILWWQLEKYHGSVQSNDLLKNKKYTYLKYTLWYKSIFGWDDSIKIEVTYTPKQYIPSLMMPIQHIYKNLVYETNIFPENRILCLDIEEMIAEKTRAALTRYVPVIRDFYDLRYLSEKWYNIMEYIPLIKYKCIESKNHRSIDTFIHPDNPDKTLDTLSYLSTRITLDLYPVLQPWSGFDLNKIYIIIKNIHKIII